MVVTRLSAETTQMDIRSLIPLGNLRSGIDTAFVVGNSVNPGVWIKAARLNNSCAGNCHRSFIGDMLILRVSKDLNPGTEFLFPYCQTRELHSHEYVQRDFNSWGFTCDCTLCAQRRVTSDRQMKER
ncbi:TPR domain protein [Cordyceps fumosorosea ARSEF 2679]|uniref:TPR domain protein n=1 Tax=Cordyceps fumosorosea (strain ARSEF 2679) TaxID=1081104 RepID=A0A168B817_CORFA|nr:TPR domain protein [Cordyceps fumosorosea ARSEF 2679]OAA69750.1 TPR domain protein [Cordyceps fumosorosea ARSEF 2679]